MATLDIDVRVLAPGYVAALEEAVEVLEDITYAYDIVHEERDHARFIADQLGKEKRQIAEELDAAREAVEVLEDLLELECADHNLTEAILRDRDQRAEAELRRQHPAERDLASARSLIAGLTSALRKANADKAELLGELRLTVHARKAWRDGYHAVRPSAWAAVDTFGERFAAVIAKHSA